MSVDIDIKKLFEAGAHFGHRSSRWHPKMAKYIHSKRGGSHIIDLSKTVDAIELALSFIEKVSSEGKQILFVGTKRQAHDIIKETAVELDMPFVVERWLGGMLTNKNTIGGRVKYLKDQEAKMENGELAAKYSKLEVQRFQEEIDNMNHVYGGIKKLAAKPGVMFVVDVVDELNAVKEAKKLGIPVVAIVDTNADPSLVDYPIPANDDAIKTIQLVIDCIKQAVQDGKTKHAKKADSTKVAEKPTKKPSKNVLGGE